MNVFRSVTTKPPIEIGPLTTTLLSRGRTLKKRPQQGSAPKSPEGLVARSDPNYRHGRLRQTSRNTPLARMTTFSVAIRPPDLLRFEREKLGDCFRGYHRGRRPGAAFTGRTYDRTLVQPEKDLAARAVPHMGQSQDWTPITGSGDAAQSEPSGLL